MELTKYGNLMKLIGKEKYFSLRKSIALEAQKRGIKPTARKFHMSKNTVIPIVRNKVIFKRVKATGIRLS